VDAYCVRRTSSIVVVSSSNQLRLGSTCPSPVGRGNPMERLPIAPGSCSSSKPLADSSWLWGLQHTYTSSSSLHLITLLCRREVPWHTSTHTRCCKFAFDPPSLCLRLRQPYACRPRLYWLGTYCKVPVLSAYRLLLLLLCRLSQSADWCGS
jgi:hypothetical protein